MEPDKAHSRNHAGLRWTIEVQDCLERGGTVVTANARAARVLRRAHTAAQQLAGRVAWQTPPIYDWQSWLGSLWRQHLLFSADTPLLLTALQEQSVWRRIVGAPHSAPDSIAVLAANAWDLLQEYEIREELRRSWRGHSTEDAEAFRGWATAFESECRRSQWRSRSELPALLSESIRGSRLKAPAEILFLGFDRITASQHSLIDAARQSGAAIKILEYPEPSTPPQLVAAENLHDELTTCAWWARRILEADPAAHIAIIVQDIDAIRSGLERIFRRVLAPQAVGIEVDPPMPFEFSLGQPLAHIPVIKAALLFLRWLAQPIDQPEVSWLTISGFLAAPGADRDEMAHLDAEIRASGKLLPSVAIDAFASFHSRRDSAAAYRFLNQLRSVSRRAYAEGVTQRKKNFSEWTDFAEAILRQTEWPGSRAIESIEFQAIRRWEQLTAEVAALAFDGSRVSYAEFVTIVDRYANETIFAPESRGAPIQIMGAFESAGQHFDALWFLGADDRQWPPTAQLNSLLPRSVQRKAEMPHSSHDLDWQLASKITMRLAASAPACVFSHALRDDAGELRSSPLLRESFADGLVIVPAATLRDRMNFVVEPTQRRETEPIEDTSAVPWPQDLDAGGADVLKHQAACPFQAFAIHRLGAKEIDTPERGLSPIDRGDLLHKILEKLWSPSNPEPLRLQTRDDLIDAIAGGRLASILTHHIGSTFENFGRRASQSKWMEQYLQVQQERLHFLLSQWLGSEAERQPFTVAHIEQRVRTSVNGLKLKLRVDRVDTVDDGHLILDYKTGKVTASMWDGERPDEPQLPLYATYARVTEDLRGVLCAQIRTGDMRLIGRVENGTDTVTTSLSPRSEPLDEETLGAWADALGTLADEFLAGHAPVAPKSYPKTCQHCPLPSLCRIAEVSPAMEEQDVQELETLDEWTSRNEDRSDA